MRDTLEFTLDDLESALEKGLKPRSNRASSIVLEVTISPEFQAAFLANKHRFARFFVIESDGRSADRTLPAD
jgi:hypothetical protein